METNRDSHKNFKKLKKGMLLTDSIGLTRAFTGRDLNWRAGVFSIPQLNEADLTDNVSCLSSLIEFDEYDGY